MLPGLAPPARAEEAVARNAAEDPAGAGKDRARKRPGTAAEADEKGKANAKHAQGNVSPADEGARSFGVVRSLAFVAMLLAFTMSLLVSIYLGNTARHSLIRKNHDFASLLADNLNNQIYRRFTLPTVSIFGRIALRNPDQYKQLDQIIQSIIQGLHVDDVRIYAHDHAVTYSTNPKELGSTAYAGPLVDRAANADGPIFTIEADIPYWQAFFSISLEPETFRMRTTYPLRIENRESSTSGGGPLMGVLEFSQDVTRDMLSAIRFQQLVLGVTLLGTGMLMGLLLLLMRRAERALALRMAKEQRLLNELHQHEKLAGMGRVVASIAHEIRNPLGIISSSAELLLKRAKDEKPGTARILEAIYDEARRLTRTVGDFLDYARPRQPGREQVDAAAVINQALAFLTPELAAREVGVVRAGELDKPLIVFGDKDFLYRAFYNIMGNAVQAMSQGGTLRISLGRTSGKKSTADIVFQDSGPGFPEDSMERLLDPFFTTKDDGTGLGLAIVNTIITSHGGALTLDNAPEGGARVRVSLPLAPEED